MGVGFGGVSNFAYTSGSASGVKGQDGVGGVGVEAVSAGGAAPLLTDLVAYWNLDETSGNRADSGPNGYTLTDNNTVGNAAGVGAGQTAASFVRANSEYLSRAGDANLRGTGGNFTVAFWVYYDAAAMGFRDGLNILSGGGWQYQKQTTDNVRWFVTNGAGGSVTALGPTLVSGTWYFVVCDCDAGAGEVGISVNNGARATAAIVGYTPGSTAPLEVGRFGFEYLSGRVQSLGMWLRQLTADERTWLYNGGTAARLYADVEAYTG